MAQSVIALKDLAVRYGEAQVIQVPDLEILDREILAVMGPNGAGKSTLLRILGFLERPTAGRVIFQGEDVEFRSRELLALHRHIAVVFQEPLLVDGTVFDNVSLGLRLRGMGDLEKRVDPWLSRFGIAHLRHRHAKALSSGEAQRTSLARAFVLDPQLLLLDEPLSALDPPTRDALLADLKSILAETQTTTVFVTHDRDEAIALGDRVAVMMQGRILQLDAPTEIFSFPVNEEVARFVGVETVLPGRARSVSEGLVTVEIDGREVEVVGEALPGEPVLICIRPEDIVLSRADMGPSSIRNHLEAQMDRAIPLGRFVRIVLNGMAPIVASITKQSYQEMGLRKGDRVFASFKATAAHIIRKPEPRGTR